MGESEANVAVFSPSGDTDIVVLAVSLPDDKRNRLILIDGQGKNQKIVMLQDLTRRVKEISGSLLGLHSISGNDYVSSMFMKGKKTWFKVMTNSLEYRMMLMEFGDTLEHQTIQDQFIIIEKMVYKLYGLERETSVDRARFMLFNQRIDNNSIPDIALLPPCKSVLQFHVYRAAYVAYYWKQFAAATNHIEDFENYGWHNDGSIRWFDEQCPADIDAILTTDRCTELVENEDFLIDEEVDSDDEDYFD